jgi:hypothetical protein
MPDEPILPDLPLADEPEPVIQLKPGTENAPAPTGWARLWAIAHPRTRPMLRSGAWYPVVSDAEAPEVVLTVRHRDVRLSAQLVEVRKDRPGRFTVVSRSRGEMNPAAGTRGDLGSRYAVCPASGHRIRLRGRPTKLECPGCGYRGEIGWDETG